MSKSKKMLGDCTKNREDWIDALRALAMIFVIYGHLLKKTELSYIYYVFTSPIKLPLFLSISGYLFKEIKDFQTFFYKVFRGLVIPWIVLSIAPLLLISLPNNDSFIQRCIVTFRHNWHKEGSSKSFDDKPRLLSSIVFSSWLFH